MKEIEHFLDEQELLAFLIKAKKEGYASGESTTIREEDGSYSTRFDSGDYKFHDSWFGGEPFGGREVVWYKNVPVWMMVYFGEDSGEVKDAIPVLRKALSLMPTDMPARGPKKLEEGSLTYTNEWEGNILKFEGIESISLKGKRVYKASYLGGLINQRRD